MRRSFINRFAKNESAAIAPMYALGIGTLVVMSAVGFDYGRLMALDTELQNAADQAALAAATQLDGTDNAMINARNAATNTFATASSQFVNQTRFANDGAGRPITSLTYRFFDGYEDDAMGDLITDDDEGADAAVVEVTVNARRVFYALTPLVGAVTSGDVIGRALAGIENAQCEVAPMFFCVPKEDSDGDGIPDANIMDFPRSNDIGRELKLHIRNNSSETFTPGNFGFLDVPYGTGSDKNRELGLNESLAQCFGSEPDVETETGFRTTQQNALNSRLDLYGPPIQPNHCDSSGNYCPSSNAKKDWVNVQKINNNAAQNCDIKPSSDWKRYSEVTEAGVSVPNPGYPDDSAFSGIVGNGSWGPSTWLDTQNSIYGTSYSLSDIPDENGNGSISRYEAFLWERDTATDLLEPHVVAVGPEGGAGGNKRNLYCAYPNPVEADPWPASNVQKDRRLLTVGAVACEDGYPNGTKDVRILRWVDLFLVRPVVGSGDGEFLTEVVGFARRADGGSGIQFFSRKKAVLIR